ncbi:MAG: VWA domain-containing protein [Firmicutes bacterium]|nr:VWA domain-containing protein [Bacillota bacterium]
MSKKGLTELVMILDRSGSMSGLEADTIGGFNSMIEKQKKEEGEAYVSVMLFDDRFDVIYDRVDIRKVEPMSERQYFVRGMTALLDAVGRAVTHISNVHKYAREEDVPEKTIFIITTDGMENASREYSYDKVRRMIEDKKEQGWEFMFLGANIDAVAEAGRIGIDARRAVRYEHDSIGTQTTFSAVSNAIKYAVRAGSAPEMARALDTEDPLEEVRMDYKKRHRR